MEKSTIIKIALTAILAVYLVFALANTGSAERNDRYSSISIMVNDSIDSGFVSEEDISAECGDLYAMIGNTSRCDINLYDIEKRIVAMPVVENASVITLSDGSVVITVDPMVPVARVFDPHSGNSYYINASGKRVAADMRFHVDVPVVVGDFDRTKYQPTDLLPMLKHIADNKLANAIVSTVTVSDRGDIMLIPVIRGHVVNFGDTANISDKFDRLTSFYSKVLPVKGWDTYDTISVKWAGRIVATRRHKQLNDLTLAARDSDFDMIDDIATMTVDSIPNSNDNP